MYVPRVGGDVADMHLIVNGDDQGVVQKDIPLQGGPLHAVVDVYGSTKLIRIVQLYGGEWRNQGAGDGKEGPRARVKSATLLVILSVW